MLVSGKSGNVKQIKDVRIDWIIFRTILAVNQRRKRYAGKNSGNVEKRKSDL